jgi:hypothetical protein
MQIFQEIRSFGSLRRSELPEAIARRCICDIFGGPGDEKNDPRKRFTSEASSAQSRPVNAVTTSQTLAKGLRWCVEWRAIPPLASERAFCRISCPPEVTPYVLRCEWRPPSVMSFTYSRLIDRQSFRCLVFDELLVDKVAPIVTSPNFSINNPTRNRSARNKNRPYVPNISPGGLRIWAGYRGRLLAVGNHLSPRNNAIVSKVTS